jgi:hypothetical protein
VGLRSWLKRLERDSRSDLPSFELMDGSRFYLAHSAALYLYYYDCVALHPDHWPEPPEPLLWVLEAKNPVEALEVVGAYSYSDIFPFSVESIISERRLVPCAIVPGEDPYERVIDDLSE